MATNLLKAAVRIRSDLTGPRVAPGNGQGNGRGNGVGGKATVKQNGKGAGGRKVQARGFSGNRGNRTKGGQ